MKKRKLPDGSFFLWDRIKVQNSWPNVNLLSAEEFWDYLTNVSIPLLLTSPFSPSYLIIQT